MSVPAIGYSSDALKGTRDKGLELTESEIANLQTLYIPHTVVGHV